MQRDFMQPFGPISSEPEADVQGVVRGAEKRDGLGQQLRSLAHPGWPYTGTPWEWRGFVERGVKITSVDIAGVDFRPGGVTMVDARFQYLNFGRLD